MAGGVHMPTGEGVSPALWVGLMGIGIMSAPTCAYAATTTATPFNSNAVSTFVAGFAVGFLITAGAFVAYACVAKRRGRAGESLEATMGPTEFSMPVGDDPQEVGVDVLGLGVAPEGQAASLRQVERLALGIEGDVEGLDSPKSSLSVSCRSRSDPTADRIRC